MSDAARGVIRFPIVRVIVATVGVRLDIQKFMVYKVRLDSTVILRPKERFEHVMLINIHHSLS